MITQADIQKMSREEKLRAMEALWQEISNEVPAPESPAWHGEVLEQTQARVTAGTEKTLSWEEAKVGEYFLDSLFSDTVVIVYRVLDLRQDPESIRDYLKPNEKRR